MLSASQERAIELILTSRSLREAAKEVGVHEQTLYRWIQEPEFKAKYEKIQHQLRENISAQIRACSDKAVRVLKKIMSDSGEKSQNRINAAKIVLDILYKDYDRKYLDKIREMEMQRQGSQANILDELPEDAVTQILAIIAKHTTKDH